MRLLGLAAPVGLLLTNQGVPPLRGLGFGLPIKQITTETGGPISAPVLEFKFCPIRLLIWHPASRGLPEFMVMDLHVGFTTPSSPRSGSRFRVATPHSFLVCFLLLRLQRAAMAGMLKLCFVGLSIS